MSTENLKLQDLRQNFFEKKLEELQKTNDVLNQIIDKLDNLDHHISGYNDGESTDSNIEKLAESLVDRYNSIINKVITNTNYVEMKVDRLMNLF